MAMRQKSLLKQCSEHSTKCYLAARIVTDNSKVNTAHHATGVVLRGIMGTGRAVQLQFELNLKPA